MPTFNLSAAAEILGITRHTLRAWLRDGAPYVRAADRTAGQDWEICIADVIAWRRAEVIAREVARHEGEAGQLRLFRERRLAAEAIVAEQRAEAELERVVDADYASARIRDLLVRIRTRLGAIGAKVAGRAASMKSPAQIKELIDQEIRESLRHIGTAEQ